MAEPGDPRSQAESDNARSATPPPGGKGRLRRWFEMRGSSSGLWVVGAVLALIAGLIQLVGPSATFNPLEVLSGRVRTTETPDIVGLVQPKALQRLDEAELKATVTFAHSTTAPRGTVTNQKPAKGQVAEVGTPVSVVVSRGPLEFEMPQLTGFSLTSVDKLLKGLGAPVDVQLTFSEDRPNGEVLVQSPLPGEIVRLVDDTKVALTVSQGATPRRVPDVGRLPIEGAAYKLGLAGFVVGKVTTRADGFLPKGAVIETNPPRESIKAKRTTVDVVVSEGPPPVSVPNLVGMTEAQAIDTVRSVGLLPSSYSRVGAVGDVNDGRVAAQAPGQGDKVDPGEVVNIEVVRAAAPSATDVPAPTVVPPQTSVSVTTSQPGPQTPSSLNSSGGLVPATGGN